MKAALLTGLLTICVGACGGTVVPASSAAVDSAAPTLRSTTPSVTATFKPSSASAAEYPYTLSWPEDELETSWRYASVAWDGTSRIDHGNKYTDQVTTRDGDLFAYGFPTTMSVAELESKVADQAVAWHHCDGEPTEREPLAAGGSVGVFAVYRCGSLPVLRWIGVHDGFGVFVGFVLKPFVDTDEAIARFKEQVGALTWGPRARSMP